MREQDLQASRLRTFIAYAAMIGLSVLALLGVQALGADLSAPAPRGAGSFAQGHVPNSAPPILHVLLALLCIVLVSRLLGALFRRIAQPAVIGEVIAGIA